MSGPWAIATTVTDMISTVRTAVTEEPALVAMFAALVILIVGAFLIIRWWRRGVEDRLMRVLGKMDSLAILMHPNPDPDAMGSAMGIGQLAAAKGTDVTLYYPGEIRHQENRAFRTVLDMELEQIESAGEIGERAIALIDHNDARGFIGAERINPDIVIDHHPGGGTGSAFTDVRPEYGACASIVAEYFERLGAELLDSDDEDGATDGGSARVDGTPFLTKRVATGLLYGIQADTSRLSKGCTAMEFSASSYLFQGADEDKLDRIANPQVTSEMLETKATAIQNRSVNGSFAISDVGEVNDVDALAQAADELVRLEGITAVVVYGSKNGTLYLSGRSRDDRVHMGQIMEAVLDKVPMGNGGGHARMGGGQVPLDYLAGIGPSAVDPERARADLRGSLFNAMKGNI